MGVDGEFKPMLLLTVNNSISNKSKHFTIKSLIELFSKKENEYSNIDKYAVITIQEEASKSELNNFIKSFKISPDKVKYLLNVNLCMRNTIEEFNGFEFERNQPKQQERDLF